MFKAELNFEKVMGTFVPGAFFSLGAWYLHRSFLLKYFPNIAGDPTVVSFGGLSTEVKALLFVFISFCIGIVFNHFADIGVAVLFRDDAKTDKAHRKFRNVIRRICQAFTITLNQDPRTRSITRYLQSPRRERFLQMMKEWAGTDETKLKEENEEIVAHQHVVVHLRVMSEKSNKLVADAYFPVTFSASILVAFICLFFVAALSFFTSEAVDEQVRVLFYKTLAGILIFIYGGMVLSNYILRRQFRQFCHHALTLAFHFHEVNRQELKSVPRNNGGSEGEKTVSQEISVQPT
jgi:hypothetical protein